MKFIITDLKGNIVKNRDFIKYLKSEKKFKDSVSRVLSVIDLDLLGGFKNEKKKIKS